MAGDPVFVALPSPFLFSFLLNRNPEYLTPPTPGSIAAAPPFHIPDYVYRAALDVRVPITIATVYAVTAKALNAYNQSTGKKPWVISRTQAFRAFVVAHNIFLAVYSAWTFWGMLGALRRSMVDPLGPQGLSGFIDSVCKIHGRGGVGGAALFSEETRSWQTHSPAVVLGADGAPSRLDGGRIWNEGLAFYGWIFYLSKFYEVLDTFIILAKGKFSSTLQTYHHAGAMMCMWAGMRYMSPPIWMFVFINSGIHAMMYTYYTLTAFAIRVPGIVKRTLTTLQITQFLVGATYAMAHSFVHYTFTVAVPTAPETVDPLAATTAPNAAGAEETASALLGTLKTMLFGSTAAAVATAAGASEDLLTAQSTPLSSSGTPASIITVTTPCVTTTGATFAIWLNVLYLAPLTYLFAKFFVESYLRRSSADYKKKSATRAAHRRRLSNEVVLAEKAGWDAARGIEREVYGQDGVEEAKAGAGEKRKVNGKASKSRAA